LSETRLIVGIGNPGKEYERTRHNLGFLVLLRLAEQLKFKFSQSSLTNGLTAEGTVDQSRIRLLLPLSYVNRSGRSVKKMVDDQESELKHVLVVCDDMNLDFGQIRIRAKGSDGGHNGLNSIIEHLGSEEFGRLRLGVGQPEANRDPAEYVLEEFKPREKNALDDFIIEAVECCLMWLKEGINKTMDQFNKRKKNGAV